MTYQTITQMIAETMVVAITLAPMRGLTGALGAWPGSGLSGTWTPQGRTANSTTHQIRKYTKMPEIHPISGLLQLDQRAAEILGMQEQHGLVMGARLRLAVAEDAGAGRLQPVARGIDVVDLVADVMDAAGRVLLQEARDRRVVAEG